MKNHSIYKNTVLYAENANARLRRVAVSYKRDLTVVPGKCDPLFEGSIEFHCRYPCARQSKSVLCTQYAP